MSLIVQKFGGSSVANAERVMNVAGIVTDTYNKGNDVIVVVSAQGDTTDDLIEKAKEINPHASKRETDMLLSAGEQISISLLAMAIEKLGYPVVSLLGWQAGFQTTSAHTSARIKRVVPDRIKKELDQRRIVIVAGFQGLNRYDEMCIRDRLYPSEPLPRRREGLYPLRMRQQLSVQGCCSLPAKPFQTLRKSPLPFPEKAS